MNTYIALFRGINVGGKNILPMKELAAILESLDCENVRTYIQSGNVVFQSSKGMAEIDAAAISKKILDQKGFEPRVLLLDETAFREAINNNPFPTENGKTLHFSFLAAPADQPDLDRLASVKADSEQFQLKGNVFYLHAPDGIGRSKLATIVEKALGVPATARNWNTVKKLATMIE